MDALSKKLGRFLELSQAEIKFLRDFGQPEEVLEANSEIIRIDSPISDAIVILEGWTMRYRYLPDGRRQIFNFGLAGDIVGLEGSLLRSADYTLQSITECRIARFSHTDWPDLLLGYPRLAAAILWVSFTEQAMFLERLVTLGRRTARERVAHLLCELLARRSLIEDDPGSCLHLPISREIMADTLGMSAVHVYRCMNLLRRAGLIDGSNSAVDLKDRDALAREADFEPAYFHLASPPWWTERALLKLEEQSDGYD